MTVTTKQILRTYIILTLLTTFASSFIWGINTLFLLDAGLSITEAFVANAFFTVGQVLFEVPTGVVADTTGRRRSHLLGSATLFISTLLYLYLWYIQGPFWAWAVASIFLGLGFTFFSGATEAWLVDGLKATKYQDSLDSAFAKGQIASGVAMLTGTVTGGVVAQATNLGVPYVLRCVVLGLAFVVTWLLMKDVGFMPRQSTSVRKEMADILRASLQHGFRNPPVRLMMLSAPFLSGVGYYAFYAMQPFLLNLYGSKSSYAIAGLAAAIVAATQILGGFSVPFIRRFFTTRTSFLFFNVIAGSIVLGAIGISNNFLLVLVLLAAWGALFASSRPIRQSYLNNLIPSSQRATVLSSDNLLTSAGAAGVQPGLARVADVWSYGTSYVVGAIVQLIALPFLVLARKEKATSDPIAISPTNE